MARSSFVKTLNTMARASAKAQRRHEAQRRRDLAEYQRQERAYEKQQRTAERLRLANDKEQARLDKQLYLESRIDEVDDLNAELAQTVEDLKSILGQTLEVNDRITFDSLRVLDDYPRLELPSELTTATPAPTQQEFTRLVTKPSGLSALLPWAKSDYGKQMETALGRYKTALDKHERKEQQRLSAISDLTVQYEADKKAFEEEKRERNRSVDELEAAYMEHDAAAIITYNAMVLERSEYPDAFPQEFQLAYIPESKELVIEYELPATDVIPEVQGYSYVKAQDEVRSKARKASEVKELYQDVVAAVCLRTIHEVLEADHTLNIQTVVFNGFVQTVDGATGKRIRPHLVSVRTTRERFDDLDLAHVDKRACLRNLGAKVSPQPAEMQAVKPVVEFDMVDKRFVEQSDILADLDDRPNLMDLSPFEFENLVGNLFTRMGLETKQTRSSKDGGVDAIAFDLRPVLGGKVVIQAKRYRNTVGVSAVRDLYGTMMNEGANKGILVTTSSYGPDAYDFARNKPVELIDGGGLLHMLDQVGVQARIIMPVE